MPAPDETQDIRAEYQALSADCRSAVLATVDADGNPEVSYAPFIETSGSYCIYVSELAAHTGNLLARPVVSLMLIEGEDEARSIFARRRLTYRCTVKEIARNDVRFDQRLDQFAQRFGELINMLRTLADFHLFELTPVSGSYVGGFARAYRINADEIRARNERGHRPLAAGDETPA